MRGDILGLERRRRWGDEQKLAIVLSVGVDGATVTQVAQRHEVTRQQVYAWRHELKKKGLLSPTAEAIFLPVEMPERQELVAASVPAAAAPAAPTPIELRLANGRCLRFDPTVDTITLKRLIRAVEAA
jgi:transposase